MSETYRAYSMMGIDPASAERDYSRTFVMPKGIELFRSDRPPKEAKMVEEVRIVGEFPLVQLVAQPWSASGSLVAMRGPARLGCTVPGEAFRLAFGIETVTQELVDQLGQDLAGCKVRISVVRTVAATPAVPLTEAEAAQAALEAGTPGAPPPADAQKPKKKRKLTKRGGKKPKKKPKGPVAEQGGSGEPVVNL